MLDLLQANEYCSIQLSIVKPLARFFPSEYRNRFYLVRVQLVSVIEEWWSTLSVRDLNNGGLIVELDRQAHSRGRKSPMFDDPDGLLQLNPRYHGRRAMVTRDEEYASSEQG
jgi:hypothetical protein